MEYNLKKLVASMWEHRKNKDFERKSLESSYKGLSVKASIGMTGQISKIPWISYCAEGQETQKGIYPVLLFYGTPEFLEKIKNKTIVKKIVLAYGISATKAPDFQWGAEVEKRKTIGDAFIEWEYKTSDNGIKKYNSSFIYKTYDWTDDVEYGDIQNDIDNIIDIYLNILSANSMKDDDVSEVSTGMDKNILNFLDTKPSQIIYYGAPGTGKSYSIREKEKAGLNCIRTTFHPDSDYATFIGCYKPYLNQELKKLTYEFVEQAFIMAYTKAWQNPQKEIALVIEEINRGNCAQIFGDIFQLLDRDKNGWSTYPIKADTDIRNYLSDKSIKGYSETMIARYGSEKSGYEYMALPPNLSLLATMNTSDQSLFPIDSAFKRRWEWKYIPIKNHPDKNYKIEIGESKYDWWQFLESINREIGTITSSEDKKLGYFFAKAEDNVINDEQFVGKVLFYLWNDVFKNYGFDNDIFNKVNKDKLAFSDFFNADGSPNHENVNLFMKNLKVKDENKKEETNTGEGNEQ